MKLRRDPNLTERNAALVLAWLAARGEPIPHKHQQLMTANQICSLVQFDHYPIRYEDGGTTHPSNLVPRLILAHREKTSKIDVPQGRKADRIRDAEAARTKRALLTDTGMPGDQGRTPHAQRAANAWVREVLANPPRGDRPKRRIRSKGFDKTKTRTFSGKVVERKRRG